VSTNPLYKNYDFAGFRAVNADDPVDDQDYVTKAWGLANLGGGGSDVSLQLALLALGAGFPQPGLATSYANTGGTGDRRSIISSVMGPSDLFTASNPAKSLANMLDGSDNQEPWGAPGGDNSGYYMRFDFGVPVWIDEFTWRGGLRTYGEWKWQVSTDGTAWGDITGSTFQLDLTSPDTGNDSIFPLGSPANGYAYRFYQMLGTGGGVFSGAGAFTAEILFKIYGMT
jgi:hypothetical protein